MNSEKINYSQSKYAMLTNYPKLVKNHTILRWDINKIYNNLKMRKSIIFEGKKEVTNWQDITQQWHNI